MSALSVRTAKARRRGTLLRTVIWAACLASLVQGSQLPAMADGTAAEEEQVKAAFLFNFAKFVEWPAGTSSAIEGPLRLCVMAGGSFEHALREVVRGKLISGHPLLVEHPRDLRGAKDCQVLFFGRWIQDKETAAVLRGLAGAGVLTVGETEDFARRGGIINFVLENNHMGFEINVDAADRAGVKISSKLLSLAKIMRDSAAREN